MTPAAYIRAQIEQRVKPLYTWGSVRQVPTVTTKNDQFPRLGVYLFRETESPDGDSNAGPPRYISETVISISVMDALSKPDVLNGSVDVMIDTIKNALLQDYTFVSLKWTDGTEMLDSIPTIQRTYNYPNNGESYYIECRLQMTFRFNVFYEPIAPNLLREVAVDVRPNGDPVAPENGATLNIELTG